MNHLQTGRPSKKEKAISLVQKMNDETIRMNVNIQKSLHKSLKLKALEEDTNLTELVKRALKEYMIK